MQSNAAYKKIKKEEKNGTVSNCTKFPWNHLQIFTS